MSEILPDKHKTLNFLWLFLLTVGAFLVQGYHPFAEDAEIYLPGVEKILHPELFPVGREFFLSHANLTFFPNVVALSLRVTHLPMGVGLLVWQVASIFLLLLACWELSGLFFPSARARWGGVCLVAALLSIPVSGTALYIVDQYLEPEKSGGFRRNFHAGANLGEEIRPRVSVVGFCCLYASFNVGVSLFVLLIVCSAEQIGELLEALKSRLARRVVLVANPAGANAFPRLSRGCQTPRLSLHSELAVV